jgi:hypothetical protein
MGLVASFTFAEVDRKDEELEASCVRLASCALEFHKCEHGLGNVKVCMHVCSARFRLFFFLCQLPLLPS